MEDLFGYTLEIQYKHLNEDVYHYLERDDNYIHHFPLKTYFRTYEEWGKAEQDLVDLTQGRVLDIGCGVGRHALHLQEKGHEVIGLDISETLLKICEERGLKHTVLGSILELDKLKLKNEIDTVLIMGNNLPLCHSEELMLKCLQDLYEMTSEDGQILIHMLTATPTDHQIHLDYHQNNLNQGKRRGEVQFRIRYENLVGEYIRFYLPTPEEMHDIFETSKWKVGHIDSQGGSHCIQLLKE